MLVARPNVVFFSITKFGAPLSEWATHVHFSELEKVIEAAIVMTLVPAPSRSMTGVVPQAASLCGQATVASSCLALVVTKSAVVSLATLDGSVNYYNPFAVLAPDAVTVLNKPLEHHQDV